MTRLCVLLATVASVLAVAQPASSATVTRYMTASALVRHFEQYGATFRDGSHIRVADGFCHGAGTRHGTLANPTYNRFSCTLVKRMSAGTAWYDVAVTITAARHLIVKVISVD